MSTETNVRIEDFAQFKANENDPRNYMVIASDLNNVLVKMFNMNELSIWLSTLETSKQAYDFNWVENASEPGSKAKPEWISYHSFCTSKSDSRSTGTMKVMIIPIGSLVIPVSSTRYITTNFRELATKIFAEASKEKERPPSPA